MKQRKGFFKKSGKSIKNSAKIGVLSPDNTFLLQYDAVCDENFVSLFKNKATDKTELGLWYEIVEPLTSACGIPYRSKKGWKWDWHIIL